MTTEHSLLHLYIKDFLLYCPSHLVCASRLHFRSTTFSLYIHTLRNIICKNKVTKKHFYADDLQLYVTIDTPGDSSSVAVINCLEDIECGVSDNFPQINDSKSEIILFWPLGSIHLISYTFGSLTINVKLVLETWECYLTLSLSLSLYQLLSSILSIHPPTSLYLTSPSSPISHSLHRAPPTSRPPLPHHSLIFSRTSGFLLTVSLAPSVSACLSSLPVFPHTVSNHLVFGPLTQSPGATTAEMGAGIVQPRYVTPLPL